MLAQVSRTTSVRQAYSSANRRGTEIYDRGRLWIENQDPASRKGATIAWWRRYQAADGQLYAVLLAAYFLMTAVPLLLLEASYLYDDPNALASRVEGRLHLEGQTSRLFRSVMVGTSNHKVSAVLVAVVDLFIFGVGFGRVLQLAHARSWGIDLRKSAIVDQVRYVEVLGAIALLTLLFVVQTKELEGDPAWIGRVLDLAWVAALVWFFVWAPRLLLHHAVPARDILPGAVFTILCFIVLRLLSAIVLRNWLEWYSKSYGALGIVMAIFFWLIALATTMVLAAALSPALAARRDLRVERSLGPVQA
jgi:uncharacterized BrkB/YihY/UPF0761 family membrane protein